MAENKPEPPHQLTMYSCSPSNKHLQPEGALTSSMHQP